MKVEWMILLAAVLSVLALNVRAADPDPGRKALLDVDREFARVTAEKGLDGWLSYFAADAAIFPPNAPIVRGLPAIREFYGRTGFSPVGLSWTPLGADLAASGDLGYTFGTWRYTASSEGKTVTRTGKYLTVWKKQSDGSWKLTADIGSPDTPRPAASTSGQNNE